MGSEQPKIVIISPCRNEEEYLPGLIECMEQQTLKPVEWIVVDDGSTDDTAGVVLRAAERNEWIRLVRKPDRGARSVGPGVVESFYEGYDRLESTDWDFICKLDADLLLGPRYFERLVHYFREDPILGAASGKLFLKLDDGRLVEERTADEMVWGAANFYRRACFHAVGGIVHQVMWDGIVFHRARMEGWRTRNIRDPELEMIDRRIMGSSHKNIYYGRRRWGKGQHFLGTHPVYILVVGLYRLFERPFLLGGINIVFGYILAWIRHEPRYDFPGFRESLHAWQLERLKIGSRLESIAPPPDGLYE